MLAGELVKDTILGMWGVGLVSLFVLRLNSKKVNPTILRYMAYLGYTDPKDLLNSPVTAKHLPDAARGTAAR